MGEDKDEVKPVSADSPSDEAGLAPKPRRSGRGGAEMAKEEELKAAGEKKPEQPKGGEPAKEPPKGKSDSKVRSAAQRMRRNIDR